MTYSEEILQGEENKREVDLTPCTLNVLYALFEYEKEEK